MTKIKRYSAFFLAELEKAMAYRFSFFTSLLADVVKTLVMYAVWVAVYQQRSTIAGFSFPMMVTYLFVSQTISNIYAFKNDASRSVARQIRKGTIIFDLLRPVHYVSARLSENLGQTVLQVFFSFLMLVIFGLIIPEIAAPASWLCFALFLLSLVIGYFIMFSVCLISGLLSFWLMNNWGLRNVRMAIVSFFSGAMVPLSMLPKWMQAVLNFLPFKDIIYTPTMIYMGQYSTGQMWTKLVIQLLWALIMWGLTEWLFSKAIHHISVNGG